MSTLLWKPKTVPAYDEIAALRYAACRESDEATLALLNTCREELFPKLRYAVCYTELAVSVVGNDCHVGPMTFTSADLARYLSPCRRAVLFAATIGVEADRLIAKYSRTSPARAVLMQALGAERVEALCDAFCDSLSGALSSRFSAGYGDFSLSAQRELFAVLQPEKAIGVCLNESLLMSPTKSVTALVGIKG